MATVNLSLPDQMKSWVEDQTQSGQYSDFSDYVCNLIQRDQERSAKIAHMQKLVDEGLASGVSARSAEDIFEAGRVRAEAEQTE